MGCMDAIFGAVDPLIAAGAVFLATFVALLLLWSAFVRALFTVFGKSGLFFIPKTLKELFLTMAFIILLVSAGIAGTITERSLISGEALKIWEILLIFSLANVFTRVVLTGLDVQHKKARDRSGLYRSIGLLKSTVGVILYLVALMVSIYVLSAELGIAIMLMGFFVIALLFAAGFDQARSIVAGLQLGDYYVDEGSLIRIDGHTGFVDEVHGRSTVIKTLDGRMVVVPNSRFFNTLFSIDPEMISDISYSMEISGKDPQKIRERISALSSKIAIGIPEVPKEFKPKAAYCGVRGGKHVFTLFLKVTPAADLKRLTDSLCSALQSEFGADLLEMRLGN
jgi:small-conductance mechanosensitive channel